MTDAAAISKPQSQRLVVLGAAALALALMAHVARLGGWDRALVLLTGLVLGFALFRTAFGFTGPWRAFIARRDGRGVRRTLAMLAAAALVTMPLGALAGYPTTVHGIGVGLLFGAFIFGLGMQFGGACGSGTAWVAGGGSGRTMITLVFFVIGSVWGSVDAPFWWTLPRFGRLALVESAGLGAALLATLAALGALAWVSWRMERGALHVAPVAAEGSPLRRLIFGPWAPLAGAVALGALAGLVVVSTGRPWGVTFGYTLYGAKAVEALGGDLASWTGLLAERPFWSARWAQGALDRPIWFSNPGTTNIGIMIGAAIAAGLVGGWRPSLRGLSARSLIAAALGGVLMGYGARISTGCNIGALVNGVASGSLHGWVWMAMAFGGSVLGVALRPRFDLAR